MRFTNFLLALAFLSLIGCQGSRDGIESTVTADVPFAPTLEIRPTISVTYSPTPSPTATVQASSTPTSTSTPMPLPTNTQTPRPTATSTLTPFPTLMPEAALTLVEELLETNGGCQLPCWWGITPGETQWADIWPFLLSFAKRADRLENTPPSIAHYELAFFLPGALNDEFLVNLTVENGVIETIILWEPPSYSLPSILAAYGAPDEVWIAARRPIMPDEPYLAMELILLYSRLGFTVLYDEEEFVEGDYVYACYQALEYPHYPSLYIWSPGREIGTLTEVEAEIYPIGLYVLPLKDATGLDIEAFYETFKDPNNTTCLETLAKLWPTYLGWPDGTPTPTSTP
jgi:hypothetical protein